MQTSRTAVMRATPIVARTSAVTAVMLCALTVRAQPVLTEAQVIRLAQDRASGAAVARATEQLARAREATAGLLQNPLVSWERETLLTGPDSTQDIVAATLPLELARPLAERALAASRSASTRADAALALSRSIADALLTYYELIATGGRVAILEQSVASLQEASRVLARRERAGTASGYESTRLAIAAELAHSRLAQARGQRTASHARLAAQLGMPARALRVPPALTLGALPGEADLARRAMGRDVVQRAGAAMAAAQQAEKRARWTWFPTLALSGGVNLQRDSALRSGYVAGLALQLPIFDHGQAQQGEARARRVLSAARHAALVRNIRGELASAYATYDAARRELQRFENAAAGRVETLLRAAHSGYREGQRTIVELLDAQRARSDVAQRRLDLLLAAKRAETRLRAAAGMLR